MNKTFANTVVSSRVRLARNVEGIPFPNRLKDAEAANRIINDVINCIPDPGGCRFYKMNKSDGAEILCLVEKNLVSKELAGMPFAAAMISGDECVSVMFHEEDHIREQCILKGFSLRRAYERLKTVDDEIDLRLDIAKDKDFGYLTSCPTNLGLGLRASVMMFLPALTMTKKMPETAAHIKNCGMTVRGGYGEGSSFDGYMYQISNRFSFRGDPDGILASVEKAAAEIVASEEREREILFRNDPCEVIDLAHRAYGVLTNAVRMSFKEALELVSRLKFGIVSGVTNQNDCAQLDALITAVKPANLIKRAGRALEPEERDIFRAEVVRETLLNAKIKIRTPAVDFR
ncbi:MAG: hypothetical protein LBP79_06870 [Clostridiales bacterium]|jgi:protein arginine kinase|nr:hypothetical protein [Clostridiales bacterium]